MARTRVIGTCPRVFVCTLPRTVRRGPCAGWAVCLLDLRPSTPIKRYRTRRSDLHANGLPVGSEIDDERAIDRVGSVRTLRSRSPLEIQLCGEGVSLPIGDLRAAPGHRLAPYPPANTFGSACQKPSAWGRGGGPLRSGRRGLVRGYSDWAPWRRLRECPSGRRRGATFRLPPVDELQREVGGRHARRPRRSARCWDGASGRRPRPRCGSGPRPGAGVGAGQDHLEGDDAVEAHLPGLVDHAHAAAPQASENLVGANRVRQGGFDIVRTRSPAGPTVAVVGERVRLMARTAS